MKEFRGSNTVSIKEAMNSFINAYKLEDKLSEIKLISYWKDEVGTVISNHTKNIYIKDKILYVQLDSSIIRNELSYSKENIINRLNTRVGKKMIDSIILR